MGGTGNFLIGLFEIFFLWAFQRCVTRPYLMNTHFWSSLGPRPILWQDRKWVGRFIFFFFFVQIFKYDFFGLSNDILHNYTSLTPIFAHILSRTNSGTMQEVGGAGPNVFGIRTFP